MIKLLKAAEPAVLQANAANWLADLNLAIASGDKKDIAAKTKRYNHPDIKEALIGETQGKCAYCEADVRVVSHGDIEHIYPKSLDRSKTFQWSNLTFSCQICNQTKSDKDPMFSKIIDPFAVDPEPYVIFVGPFINCAGTTEGRLTIYNLGLERTELMERRNETFKNLIRVLDLINGAKTNEERDILIEDFEQNELARAKEFTALRRDFWKAHRPA